MCTVSQLGDMWGRDKTSPYIYPPAQPLPSQPIVLPSPVTKEDFDKLKKEVENLKKLLLLGKAIDKATNQPDCEMAEKVDFLREVAELVGIDLDEIFA